MSPTLELVAQGHRVLPALLATASSPIATAHVSLISVLFRLLISLGVVLGVVWLLAQYVRRRGMPGSGRGGGNRSRAPGPSVEVLTRQSLGKGIGVAAVRVGATVLLLGVTSQTVTTLGELDPDTFTPGEDASVPMRRASLLAGGDRPTLRSSAGMFRVPQGSVSPAAPATWSTTIERFREMTARRQ